MTVTRILLMGAMLAALPACGSSGSRHDYDYIEEHHLAYEGPPHVCTPDCHTHYYTGRRLVVLDNHRHGPGCGHAWSGRYWVDDDSRHEHGDRRGRRPHRDRHEHGETAKHVCTPDCHDHFWNGSRLVTLRGHRHGPDCGHVWKGRHWVAAGRSRGPAEHVCTRDCHNHVHDGRRLVTLRDHRHGPNCGHTWNGRHWIAQR